jgi:hypothetical protein
MLAGTKERFCAMSRSAVGRMGFSQGLRVGPRNDDGLYCPHGCGGTLTWDAPTDVIRCVECEHEWAHKQHGTPGEEER